jgi:hypothetical protein
MPRFHVFFRGEASSHVYFAATPKAARTDAMERHGGSIRKVKLDRETIEPCNSAPRLTRRQILGEPHDQHR